MLCLSGFELYSRWVPLLHVKSAFEIDHQTRDYYTSPTLKPPTEFLPLSEIPNTSIIFL